jgi:hypothetical protein
MIIKIINVVFASVITLISLSTFIDNFGKYDWLGILVLMIILLWFAGAIGLLLNKKSGWYTSLIGAIYYIKISIFQIGYTYPNLKNSSNLRIFILGIIGLVLSLVLIIGLFLIRKSLASSKQII